MINSNEEQKKGLDLLRKPFEKHQISKLPKPTKKQTDDLKADFKIGIRCKECGGWHHKDVIHLNYVGHAALTDRLLECDQSWNWEPMALNNDGTPKFDSNGGLWIKLTVCGVTRFGYGHSDSKSGGDAIKETIGDALRNAAMRFGAALDLWHKGDLHLDEEKKEDPLQASRNVAAIKDVLKESNFNQEAEQVTRDSNSSSEYIIGFGKNKGKKLSDVPDSELKLYLNWLRDKAEENQKPLSGATKELYDKGTEYLNNLFAERKKEPIFDSDEKLQF